MSDVAYPPPGTAVPGSAPHDLEYGSLPSTGERIVAPSRALAHPDEEAYRRSVRWGAVFAGFVIAIGTQILLGLLGVAFGMYAAKGSLNALTVFAAIWFGATALVSNFIGGIVTGRTGAWIKRGHGAMNAAIAWALGLAIGAWVLGPAIMSAAANLLSSRSPRPDLPTSGLSFGEAAGSAWYFFGIAAITLLAAMIGGAVGARRRATPGG